jgi:hypothetical protein
MMEPEERVDAEDEESRPSLFINKQRTLAENASTPVLYINQNIEIIPFALFEKHEI